MYSIIEQFDVIVRSSRIEKKKKPEKFWIQEMSVSCILLQYPFEKSNHSKYLKYDGCNHQMWLTVYK